MLINYRAPSGLADGERPYPSYSFRRLFMSEQQLLGGETPMIDPAVFKDKIVFIGFTASGLVDVFNSPFGDDQMPGIQLHASMTDSILSTRFITPASPTRADRGGPDRRHRHRAAVGVPAVRRRRRRPPRRFWAAGRGSPSAAFKGGHVAEPGRSR